MKSEAITLDSFSNLSANPTISQELIAVENENAFGRRLARWIASRGFPMLVGAGALLLLWWLASIVSKDLPGPLTTFTLSYAFVRANFWGDGNRIGLPVLVLYSLIRVLAGFALGALAAIPLGFWIGTSDFAKRALSPIIELCRPISPLAWYPVALVLFSAPIMQNDQLKPPTMAATFVIFICSLWPTVLNTAFGASQISPDYINVARMLKMSRGSVFRKIYWPATLPHIVTGLRISLGIAWMVIVAAEMLNGQDGIGFFCWDQYNAGSVDRSILAMACIGTIGMLLNFVMMRIEKAVQY
jgi:nitrate/nitrite transport system permease protein